jgi:hypothetical protein
LGDDLDARGLVGSVSHGPSHLLMSEGLGGVRPERELGAEHGLEKEGLTVSRNPNAQSIYFFFNYFFWQF